MPCFADGYEGWRPLTAFVSPEAFEALKRAAAARGEPMLDHVARLLGAEPEPARVGKP